MAYAATYINEFQFSVPADVSDELRIGTVLALVQDTPCQEYITVSLYDFGDDITIITVEGGLLEDSLTEVKKGPLFVDHAAQESNLSKHDHSAAWQGGYKAFSKFTDGDIVDRLLAIGGVSSLVANFLLGVNAAGTGLEHKELKGTENQITVDVDTAGEITLSTPQDIHDEAAPKFAGLTITDEAGFIVGDSDGVLEAVAPSAGNQVVRSNVANDGFEAVDLAISNCKDVAASDWQDGQTLVRSGSGFVNGFTVGGSGGTDVGTVLALITMFGGTSVEESDVSVEDYIDGGSTPLDADKLEVTWTPTSIVPATHGYADAADQLAAILKGIDNALTLPSITSYAPPSPKVVGGTTTNNLIIPKGDYWFFGARYNGSYHIPQYRKATIASDTTYTWYLKTDTFNSIPDSWYALFIQYVIATTTTLVQAFPLFRVNAVSYSDPFTYLTPGTHDDHTVEDTAFIATSDQWNGCKLIHLTNDSKSGTVYTIADTEDTNNRISVGGNITASVSAGDWLMIVPDEATNYYCYLGMVRTANTDNQLVELERGKDSWEYYYGDTYPAVSGNLHGTTPADVSLASLVPPTARKAHIQVEIDPSTTVTDIGVTSFRNSSDSTGIDRYLDFGAGAQQSAVFDFPIEFYLPCVYRHYIYEETDPAETGNVRIISFTE